MQFGYFTLSDNRYENSTRSANSACVSPPWAVWARRVTSSRPQRSRLSRGEPADLGNPPGVDRQDLIDSNGAPSFIVNEVNLTVNAALADGVIGKASVDFLPRTGTDFRLGDAFEVDIASLEWQVGAQRRTSIYVGKFDSVLGIEYRSREANQRFGITPSLIARSTAS